jgi:hypothetical protein
MPYSSLFTTEKSSQNPILIIDKRGIIGRKLAEKLKNESAIVFISQNKPNFSDNLIYISLSKHFPKIPENKYSHIIVIDEKFELNNKIQELLLRKAKKDNAIIFFGIGSGYLSEKKYLKFISVNENVKLGILGDIFTRDKIFDSGNTVNKILLGIRFYGKIYIPGDGTGEIKPVLLEDAVSAILEICFSDYMEKTFYLLPKNTITYLTFAAVVKKIYPEIKIDFVKEKQTAKKEKFNFAGTYVLGENYEIEKKIKKINLQKIEVLKKSKVKKTKKAKNSIFLTLLFFLTLLLLPLTTSLVGLSAGKISLTYAQKYLSNGNSIKAERMAIISKQTLFISTISINILKQELVMFNLDKPISGLNDDIARSFLISKIYYSFSAFLTGINSVIIGNSHNPSKDFTDSISDLNSSNYNSNLVLDKENSDKVLRQISNIFGLTSPTVNLFEDVFGFNGERNYLILAENNSRVSSSSADFNSYAIFKIKDGKTVDTNLNNNFLKSASPAASISDLTPGIKIDGVITFDKIFLDKLIKLNRGVKGKDLLTIDLLDFLSSELREKHLLIFLADKNEQSIMSANGFSGDFVK